MHQSSAAPILACSALFSVTLFGVILLSLASLFVSRIPSQSYRLKVQYHLSLSLFESLLTAQVLQGVDSGEQTKPVLRIGHIQLRQVMLLQPHQVIHCLVTIQLERGEMLLRKQVGEGGKGHTIHKLKDQNLVWNMIIAALKS